MKISVNGDRASAGFISASRRETGDKLSRHGSSMSASQGMSDFGRAVRGKAKAANRQGRAAFAVEHRVDFYDKGLRDETESFFPFQSV